MRHDWLWPLDTGALLQRFGELGFGWSGDGFGHANPYPMTYFVVGPLALIALIAGSRVALAILLMAIGASLALAAARISRAFSLGWPAWFVLTVFLTANSFTYTKLVAGHLTQTLAIAGVAIFWAELVNRNPSRSYLTAGAILSALQTQFFLLTVVAGLACVKRRGVRTALIVSTIVFSPSIVGIVANAHTLLGWPMTVAWEDQQSVSLVAALGLGGFFAGYDGDFARIALPAELGFFALGAIAMASDRRRAVELTGLVTALALLVASGTRGPLGAVWRWAIVHAPVVGVYRELYDLIGVVAVGYAVLAAAALARFPKLGIAAGLGSAALVAAWFYAPPDRFWISAAALPAAPRGIEQVARFALVPAFQPLTWRGRGSGGDPLLVGSAPDNVSLNAMLAEYPADVALAAYEGSGDVAPLARLGVGMIACRAGFAPAEGSRVMYGRTGGHCGPPALLARGAPLLGIEADPAECSLCGKAGAGNLLVGDGPRGWWKPIAVPRVDVDPAVAWTDARLQFAQRPSLGEPFGGAYTEQSALAIGLPDGPFILANVRGALRSGDGAWTWRGDGTFAWIPRPPGVRSVRCEGACLIAAVGDPAGVPLEATASPTPAAPVPVNVLLPWLFVATVEPHARGTLRFLEAYDASWTAIATGNSRALLPHVRLDGVANGWRLGDVGGRVVLVEFTAALQFVAALCGGASILTVVGLAIRERRRLANP